MIFYFISGIIYWVFISNQITFMIKNRCLPFSYVRYYNDEDILNFNYKVDKFLKSYPPEDSNSVYTSLITATWLVLFFASIIAWPVMLFVDILTIFKHQ